MLQVRTGDVALWVGESSNEWTGGLPNRSDVVFDAFYFAEQLQVMASANVSSVVRQDLLGMYYQLLSYPGLLPRPSYWVAFLWKLLVGREVFAVSEASALPVPVYVHASVHCGRRPGVSRVAVLINFHNTQSARIALSSAAAAAAAAGLIRNKKNSTAAALGAASKDKNNLTAFVLRGPVYSDHVSLNDAPLTLGADGSLPMPKGAPVVGNALELPPASIAFLEMAGEKKCV